ncbi:MAG TPA: hypothetical protein VF761_01160 [Gemmatimonadaceae bacterium]
MRVRRALAAIAASCLLSVGAMAQSGGLPDVPETTTSPGGMDSLTKLFAPAIAQARATYPQARKRFLAGLPAGHRFAVTTGLRDDAGHREQIFVYVDSIRGETVFGKIASEITLVRGYRYLQPLVVAERDVLDWTIVDPRGNEEGNFVGKFIDEMHARQRAASVGTVPFNFATEDSDFAVIGDFAGDARVTADSVIVTLRSGSASAHAGLDSLTDVVLRATLAYEATGGDWAVAVMSEPRDVAPRLAGGARASIGAMRFALPRPPYPLARFWLVFRFEAVAHTAGRPPREFAAYAHGATAMFAGYK